MSMFVEIDGWPDYLVSDNGEIYSKRSNKLMKQQKVNGYMKVKLSNSGLQKLVAVHRIVATAFVPNPFGLPFVNHKDEDSANNAAENLEWCTAKYNCNYGTRNRRIQEHRNLSHDAMARFQKAGTDALSKKTRCVETGEVFGCAKDASRSLGINHGNLCRAARCNSTAGGYHWEYV